MDVFIIPANLMAIAGIFLIIVYLWLDRKRFFIERQFRAVKPLFDRWMELAALIPGCKPYVEEYCRTRDISAKYRAIGHASRAAWGHETREMAETAEELSVFLGVYHALAEEYNRRLNGKFTGKIAVFLGFKKFPNIQLETTYVQN